MLGSPSVGQSSYYENINGKQRNITTYSQTYTLRAKIEGTFTIDKARLSCKKGKDYESEAVKINVISQGDVNKTKEGVADYYITLEANKTSVYVGESFILSLKYYSKKRPSSVEGYENGSSGGLWRSDLRNPSDPYSIYQQDIKGSRYYIIELRKELCIPLNAGKMTISPSYASVIFNRDFFTNVRQDGYSNSVEIDVKPIPGDKPENFNGLVGQFELTHAIDKTDVNAGEAIEVNIAIKGSGNFNAFDDPHLDLPKSFLQQDPVSADETKATANGIEGEIDYKFSFTPTEEGVYTILPYSFSYFDPNAGCIKMASTEEFEIKVHPRQGGDIIIDKGPRKFEVETKDIRYINENSDHFFREDDLFFGTVSYSLAISSPLLLAMLSEDEKVMARQKVAKRSAFKDLKNARTLLSEGKDKEALKSLESVLHNFLMVKLKLSLSGLSRNNITTALKEKGIENDMINRFSATWDKMEMAQYAPITSENMASLINEVQILIDNLNQQLS